MKKDNMCKKYIIKGLVQGIGYRPFVARLAEEIGLKGWVRNTGGIVTVMACGNEDQLEAFGRRLSLDVPAGGFVNSIEVEEAASEEIKTGYQEGLEGQREGLFSTENGGFRIISSDDDKAANLPFIPADIATCKNCQEELFDPKNRRYLHPFISCTVCGPRYSIIENLPYDRDTITMRDFALCPECQGEYTAKNDVRRHAQTIACKSCGPRLKFIRIKDKNTDNVTECGKVDNIVDIYNDTLENTEISRAARLLKDGGILAIKDIGGYHLACDPFNEAAVKKLRILKHREEKAFAVMFFDICQVRKFCYVNEKEEELLESSARPIVLVKRRDKSPAIIEEQTQDKIADNVCLNSPDIGAMLPCNPIQLMLVKECGPLIMTSGNASGDVLEIDDLRMENWLKESLNSMDFDAAGNTHANQNQTVEIGMLSHNRRILRPLDDSVMKIVAGRQQFIRRGRGHVPNPIAIDVKGEVFAAGGDLKSSFCFVKNNYAYVSQYLGDLESVSCQKFYRNEMKTMEGLFGFNPNKVAIDMHEGYFSRQIAAKYAKDNNLEAVELQHHKAHVAAVMAEHHLQGQVLGFAFDGTGKGEDATVWGSEVFVVDKEKHFKRVAHLKTTKLLGGNNGAKNCDAVLTAMLHANGLTPIKITNDAKLIMAALDKNINTIWSSSMGRLFDAMAALLDVCHYNSYEGQAPVELENAAARTKDFYELKIGEDGSTKELFEGALDILKMEDKVDVDLKKSMLARGFIYAVADSVIAVAKKNRIKQVVLSGGTFLNRILLEKVIAGLEDAGFEVYISEQLPPGDGSICLGQAYLLGK